MCGIAGTAGSNLRLLPDTLQRVGATLSHRGPDDRGVYSDGHCGMVHCRLSILDLSDKGHQPMEADERPVWITYNGEIYNYVELRERLVAHGWRFRSGTDTEVILKGYLQWGTDVFDYLRGMYALAIWDAQQGSLLLARDPFGIKPLYYSLLPSGQIIFGSELKALLSFPEAPRRINPTAVGQYLRYLYVPEPLSIYQQISKVPAGVALLWKGGEVRVASRCLPPHLASGSRVDDCALEAWEARTLDVLRESVARHLIADVPVGVMLSGGVDSSLITALMREVSGGEIHTFTIGFSERLESYDESQYARTVARHIHSCHHEIKVDSSVVGCLEEVLSCFDEPFGNPAALIASVLSEYTRRYVKVVLSGVGGDEFFGGYPRYLAMSWYSRLLGRFPSAALRAAGILQTLPASEDRKSAVDRAGRLAMVLRNSTRETFLDNLVSFLSPAAAATLLDPAFCEGVQWRDPARLLARGQRAAASWAMEADTLTYLPGDLLTYTDRTSMRHGLEVRTPFVDRQVAELAACLPERAKLRGVRTKWILKRIARRLVPRETVYRKKKGFSLPIAHWLRGELRGYVDETLSQDRLRNIPELNAEAVGDVCARHLAGDDSFTYPLWALLVYTSWRKAAHPEV